MSPTAHSVMLGPSAAPWLVRTHRNGLTPGVAQTCDSTQAVTTREGWRADCNGRTRGPPNHPQTKAPIRPEYTLC